MLELEETDESRMPLKREIEIIDQIVEAYRELVSGANTKKPNGLFLARVTWNNTTELIWRIYRPEAIHIKLTEILKEERYLRPFDYRIDDDVNWKLAQWHLDAIS